VDLQLARVSRPSTRTAARSWAKLAIASAVHIGGCCILVQLLPRESAVRVRMACSGGCAYEARRELDRASGPQQP
jgi:hypothetical protein